jgi:HSP20 family molecular chaperone IbpA
MAEERELQVQEAEKQEIVEEGAERARDRRVFVPRADIYETEDTTVVVADMPGVDEDSVEITLEQGVVKINGYVDPVQPEGYTLAYSEYDVGDYQRSFRLSNQVDQDNIEATLKNGVLRLYLPKLSPATKKISVKSS